MSASGRGLRDACLAEIDAFCQVERDLLAVLATRNVQGARLHAMEQELADCLTGHAQELSAACVRALAAKVEDAETQLAAVTKDKPAENAPPKEMEVKQPNGDAAVAIPLPVGPELPVQLVQSSAAAQHPEGLPDSAVEVRVFFINHHNAAANVVGASPYLRVGGEQAAQYTGGHHLASMAITPWLGLLVLPFFCIGIYFAVTRTMLFVRRRRDVLYQVQTSNHDYQPIPTSKLMHSQSSRLP